jgi:multidrug resistance protein, MATE family
MLSDEHEGGQGGSGIVAELRLLWSLAWPSGLSMLLRMGTMQTTMIVVGHMGTEELAAVALGNMWVAMVGMTLVYGGFSGLDTLASQAYGAKNYEMVGLWTQRAVVIVCIVCVLLVPLWWFATTPCLILAGIPPENAARAGEFAKVQICWMFPAFMNRAVQGYWRAQRIVKP